MPQKLNFCNIGKQEENINKQRKYYSSDQLKELQVSL